MQGNVRIKYTSWISEMGHICHGWTFGTWTASAPRDCLWTRRRRYKIWKCFIPDRNWRHLSQMNFWPLGPLHETPRRLDKVIVWQLQGIVWYHMLLHGTIWYLIRYCKDRSRPRSRSGHLDKVTVGQLQTLPLKVDVGGNVKQGNVKKKLTNQKKKCWNTKHIASQWLDQWTHRCM